MAEFSAHHDQAFIDSTQTRFSMGAVSDIHDLNNDILRNHISSHGLMDINGEQGLNLPSPLWPQPTNVWPDPVANMRSVSSSNTFRDSLPVLENLPASCRNMFQNQSFVDAKTRPPMINDDKLPAFYFSPSVVDHESTSIVTMDDRKDSRSGDYIPHSENVDISALEKTPTIDGQLSGSSNNELFQAIDSKMSCEKVDAPSRKGKRKTIHHGGGNSINKKSSKNVKPQKCNHVTSAGVTKNHQQDSSPELETKAESPKDYIHVRARRGQATDSHSLAERARREKIRQRMKKLEEIVPGCSTVTGKAQMLDEIINYIQSLQSQIMFLSMKLKLASPVVPLCDFNEINGDPFRQQFQEGLPLQGTGDSMTVYQTLNSYIVQTQRVAQHQMPGTSFPEWQIQESHSVRDTSLLPLPLERQTFLGQHVRRIQENGDDEFHH